MTTEATTTNHVLAFDREVDPTSVGLSRAGVHKIVDIFEQQFAEGLHSGAQLVLARRGQVVLDRTIGVTRLGSRRSIRPDTPFLTFSCTKPLTGLCVHQLIEQGLVELDAPIATYWPEFGTNGKREATVRHAFLHQAGIPARGLYPQIPRWWNWERVTEDVASLSAEFVPGTRTAYHLVNYGFILGEIVRRVTGLRIEDYMRTHIFEPLGMKNAYLGLPTAEAERAAQVYWDADQRNTVLLFRRARHAVIPAASLNCSARDLAIFYQMMLNKGEYGEARLVKPATAVAATRVGYTGIDELLESFTRWSLGFAVGGPRPEGVPNKYHAYGEESRLTTFGHPGQRSCLAWADWDAEVILIFLCNRLIGDVESGKRWENLSNATWEALL